MTEVALLPRFIVRRGAHTIIIIIINIIIIIIIIVSSIADTREPDANEMIHTPARMF